MFLCSWSGVPPLSQHGAIQCTYEAVYRICDLSRSRYCQEIRKRVSKKRPAPEVVYAMMTPGLCTPVYAAPELLGCPNENLLPYGPAADVWGLGCIMFESLTGAYLAQGHTTRSVLELVRGGGVEARLDAFSAAHPSCQWPVIRPALAVDPGARSLAATVAETVCRCSTCPTAVPHAVSALPEPFSWSPEVGPPSLATVVGKCECSRHCYQPNHKTRGCKSRVVAKGSLPCADCMCTVASCTKPRIEGPLCHSHRRHVGGMPWSLRAVRELGQRAEEIMPIDVCSFLSWFPRIQSSLPHLVVAALLKEPSLVSGWLSTLASPVAAVSPDQADVFRQQLLGVCFDPKALGDERETKRLCRQGSYRFTGPAAVLRDFDIAHPTEDDSEHGVVLMGVRQRPYKPAGTDASTMQKILVLAQENARTWDSALAAATFQDAARLVREVVVCLMPLSTQKDHVIRKLFLGVWLRGPLQHVDWDGVSMSVARAVSPDAGRLLDAVPATWDAAEVSRLFFNRPGRAPFVSMWGCLFREVEQMCEKKDSPTARDYMLSQLRSGEFCSIASAGSDSLTLTPAEVATQLLGRHAKTSVAEGARKKGGRKLG